MKLLNKQVKLNQVLKNGVLYHYTKCNGINGILNTNCFWATKSDLSGVYREQQIQADVLDRHS